MGQEAVLPPRAELSVQRYRAASETSEHEHCLMCSAKFMDPDFSPTHAEYMRDHPEVLTEGYATQPDYQPQPVWVCPECFADFSVEFGWRDASNPTH